MLRGLIDSIGHDFSGGITISSFGNIEADKKEFPSCNLIQGIGSDRSKLGKAKILFVCVAAIIRARFVLELFSKWFSSETKIVLESVRRSDLVIATGGPFFSETYTQILGRRFPTLNILVPSAELLVARLYGKKYAIVGQGFGNITSFPSKFVLSMLLRDAHMVTSRDAETTNFLSDEMQLNQRVIPHPDLALACNLLLDNDNFSVEYAPIQPYLLLNVRFMPVENLRYLLEREHISENEAKSLFLEVLVDVIKNIRVLRPDLSVVFIAQAIDNDEIASQEVAQAANLAPDEFTIIRVEEGLEKLVSAIRNADYYISTRYHAALVGLMCGVKMVSLEYEKKVTRALSDYGIVELGVRGDQFNARSIVTKLTNRGSIGLSDEERSRLRLEVFSVLKKLL